MAAGGASVLPEEVSRAAVGIRCGSQKALLGRHQPARQRSGEHWQEPPRPNAVTFDDGGARSRTAKPSRLWLRRRRSMVTRSVALKVQYWTRAASSVCSASRVSSCASVSARRLGMAEFSLFGMMRCRAEPTAYWLPSQGSSIETARPLLLGLDRRPVLRGAGGRSDRLCRARQLRRVGVFEETGSGVKLDRAE